MEGPRTTYTGVAQAVHWASALLILAMLPMGLVMTRIGAGSAQESLYRAHVAVGLVVLALTAFRLVWLLFHRWPAPPPKLSPLNERALAGTHILLYAVLLAMVMSGVGMLALSGAAPSPAGLTPADIEDVPPRMAHSVLSKVFIALLVVHLAGVLNYQLRKGDTLSRMGVRGFGRRGADADPPGG